MAIFIEEMNYVTKAMFSSSRSYQTNVQLSESAKNIAVRTKIMSNFKNTLRLLQNLGVDNGIS